MMWFYFVLLVLLNIGLGYGAGRYYLQYRNAKSTEIAIATLGASDTNSETDDS